MSKAMWARLVGLLFVGLGVAVLIASVALGAAGAEVWTSAALAALAILLALPVIWWLRRTPVLSVNEAGYRVRFIRGAGVREAVWRDVADLATMTIQGASCLVVHLNGGGRTTIPVAMLAVERDELVRHLREVAKRAQKIKPLKDKTSGLSDSAGESPAL